ncbi:TasA family protein [Pyrococcus yayanosii]|uniref:Methyltransferase n=1 Tax=Pyrococcus yayanosii (strain CH1 / JCM 16557) TaxID=529709 RepID=F8AI01_PYRYC|nr:TasA family protein [Pyrococcus yayanosii]AEH25458.1 methyltransferase [Pyrococcus yayanosii CH1]
MKKSLVLMVVLTIILAASWGTATFRDVAKSEGNTISTGEFNIKISKSGERFYDDLRLFTVKALKPGDETTITFYVKNQGDIPVSRIIMNITVQDIENKMSPAEKEVDNTPDVGELSKHLRITSFLAGNTRLPEVEGKTLAEIRGRPITIFSGRLEEEEILKVIIKVKLDENAGNECQTDSVNVDIKLIAEQ